MNLKSNGEISRLKQNLKLGKESFAWSFLSKATVEQGRNEDIFGPKQDKKEEKTVGQTAVPSESGQNLAGFPAGFQAGYEAETTPKFFQNPQIIRPTIRPKTGQIPGRIWYQAIFNRKFLFPSSHTMPVRTSNEYIDL